MATLYFTLEIDRTYPKNDPSDPAYVQNLKYTISEPNAQNGLSWSFQNPSHVYTSGPQVGDITGQYAKPGIIVLSGLMKAAFPENDVKKWTFAFKDAIAYYVELGAIVAKDHTGTLTADQVRTYA